MVTTNLTAPYLDQKPGTSGLRKKVTVFEQNNYLSNFVQATFDACRSRGIEVQGQVFCIGGDGRYYSHEAVAVILRVAAGNGVAKVIVGKDTLMSTPAMSNLIRTRREKGEKVSGGFILTASHNPGGPTEDFGVKFNCANGGPALESLTDEIFRFSKDIKQFLTVDNLQISDPTFGKIGSEELIENSFICEVVDPIEDYLQMLSQIFDLKLIKEFVKKPGFKLLFDGMHGVAGPYANRLFIDELGLPLESLMRCDPLSDFGNLHPDPNLVHAAELVQKAAEDPLLLLAAACDGDADRNIILGHGFFVNPSDSVAVIAANAEAIPYFRNGKLAGVARSMPTSSALDRVAKAKKLDMFEVPTGWKYFGNLMDAGLIQICGEESFGTSGDHCREKDGLWAVMAWLNIIAYENRDKNAAPFIGPREVTESFWKTYGRCVYSRYDFEGVDTDSANRMWNELGAKSLKNVQDACEQGGLIKDNPVDVVDNFEYTDSADGSVTKNQGIRVIFKDGSSIKWRLSGTGSVGATVRIYFERFASQNENVNGLDPDKFLNDYIRFGLELSRIRELTGRDAPTVIT